MDWIYICPARKNGKHGFEWNLILRDDLSGVGKFTPARVLDAETTMEALMEVACPIWVPCLGYGVVLRVGNDEEICREV